MKSISQILSALLFCGTITGCTAQTKPSANKEVATGQEAAISDHKGNPYYSRTDTTHLQVSNDEWKKILPAEVYKVGREQATETAFTGKYWKTDVKGMYYCAICGNPLFRSTSKFASSCGWPSFFESLDAKSVRYEADNSFDMERTEVICNRCDSHLGHVFNDGPKPTGKRFCMNSAVLDFVPDDPKAE